MLWEVLYLQLLQEEYHLLPSKPGVYFFLDEKSNVLYVGKARDLKKRVSSYFQKTSGLGEKTRLLVSQIKKIKYIIVESEFESLLLEANYIKKYNPKFNSRLTDGKAYLLVKITAKESRPSVLLARRNDDAKAVFFGPYPSASDLKLVLRTVRRLFPYQSVKNHPKRICLYYHLGLCPCPPLFTSIGQEKAYKKDIKRLIMFLNGKTKDVVKELAKERNQRSKQQDFEMAKGLQKKIQAITLITAPTRKPFEYEQNPNLRLDVRRKELDDLTLHLQKNGVDILEIHKIECFDISNISGTNAVGSMVVSIDGEKESSLYRRFKIRKGQGMPNDFAMMYEVLSRRLTHEEWEYPDLIIVDGGKGQISSAKKALQEAGVSIPLVGLAKREETIITSDFKEINLPKDSGALHVVQRIRDEAHRFAITYHRKLRSNSFL